MDNRHCEEPQATKQSGGPSDKKGLTEALDLFAQLPAEIEQRDDLPPQEREGSEHWFSNA